VQYTEAEEQLAKILYRPQEQRLRGVGPKDVDPLIEPGYVVLRKRCKCVLRSILYLTGETLDSGFHHHVVPIPEDLWKRLSEERGWPQERWRISED
jgi:hypothetical protein